MMLLKKAREKQGITQAELADRAGTTQPAISALEAGRRYPSKAVRERIEDALEGIKVDWLATRLSGPINLVGFVEGEAPEDSALRAVLAYVKSAPSRREAKGRVEFIRRLAERLEGTNGKR